MQKVRQPCTHAMGSPLFLMQDMWACSWLATIKPDKKPTVTEAELLTSRDFRNAEILVPGVEVDDSKIVDDVSES